MLISYTFAIWAAEPLIYVPSLEQMGTQNGGTVPEVVSTQNDPEQRSKRHLKHAKM